MVILTLAGVVDLVSDTWAAHGLVLLSSAMASRPGRVGVVVGWVWVGFHFMVR